MYRPRPERIREQGVQLLRSACRLCSLLLLVVLLWGPLSRPALAQSQDRASVYGYVSDAQTGETLIAANLAILETQRGGSSNSAGYYALTDLEPGSYTLAVSFIGYRMLQQPIELEAGEQLRLDLELVPEGVQLEEIVVQSEEEMRERRNIGIATMEAARVRELPAVIEPDLFRSIQLMPGVKAASDYSSGLYIRGGSPDQTLILLDETTVYNPTHFFGFYSTFNPDAIKDVRLYKGGYPAEYGGRIGSVLTVYNKDGNRNEFGGVVSAGMLASRAMLEGPHRYGSWMVAVRRSTLEPLLAALRTQSESIPDKFHFLDINARVNADVTPRDRLTFSVYQGQDRLSVPFADDASIRLNYGNRTGSLNWRHIFHDRLFGRLTATISNYYSDPDFRIAGTDFNRINRIEDLSIKADLEYLPSEHHTVTGGIWAGIMNFRFQDRFDGNVTFTNRSKPTYASAYVQDRWELAPRWTLEGGLRLSHFSEGNYTRLEPRLSLEHEPDERIRLQFAYGRYVQHLTLVTNEAFSGFDIWLTTDHGVTPAWGDQWVAGVKTLPFEGYQLDMEVYYRTMQDLFELNPFIQDVAGIDYEALFRFGKGYAWGAEWLLEKKEGPWTGHIGYTFSITRRKFPGFNTPPLGRPGTARFYAPKYDRTHDLTMVASRQLSRRWRLNAVFSYATGQAYTEPTGRTQIGHLPWGNISQETFIVEELNRARLPAYHRLDLGAIRTGTFFGRAQAEWQFQIINAYSRRNIWFYQYDFDENPVEKSSVPLLPILPAISYTVQF
ncbi:MAG: TonB-dependent receptor [Balneolaceae bacterium]